ncbi:MAG: RNA polymerase sigma factor [Acidimicrobiales bacterium]
MSTTAGYRGRAASLTSLPPTSATEEAKLATPASAERRSTDDEFVAFVTEIETDLKRTSSRLSPSGVDPDDIAAEALARAYAHWTEIGVAHYRRAWVFRVVTNLALSAHSSGRRRAASLRRWSALPASGDGRLDDDVVNRELLRKAMRQLPVRQREAIALHYFADLPIAETAQAMGVGAETAKTHINRALVTLRAEVGTHAEETFHA